MEKWFQKSDQELMLAVSAGDPNAFQALFNRHYSTLVAYIHRFTGNINTAKDIAQDVMAKIWVERAKFSQVEAFDRYMIRMGRNAAINALKKKDPLMFNFPEALHENIIDPTDDFTFDFQEDDNNTSRLNLALAQLPEKCRIVFEMSRFDNLSHKQIAETLDISTKTIENQITKAFKILRNALLDKTTTLLFILSLFL
jgi:RNA polymerase sigma-70 factor, ECF subfamily